jgi:hypothetical protein
MSNTTPYNRHPTQLAPTKAIISPFAKKPVTPLAGTTGLSQSQLSSASAPTRIIKSGQGRHH